jgi:hypothetical protein
LYGHEEDKSNQKFSTTSEGFKIVQGREYFTGPVDEAIRMVEQIRRFVNDKMGTP